MVIDVSDVCIVGMANFINKLWIGPMMTILKVEQLYVVITTLILGACAATIATFCTEFYQFVLAAIMYGGCSRKSKHAVNTSNDISCFN